MHKDIHHHVLARNPLEDSICFGTLCWRDGATSPVVCAPPSSPPHFLFIHLFILCRHVGSRYQGAFSFVGPEHPQVASSSLKLLATVSWREGWCHRLVQLAFHEMLNKVSNFSLRADSGEQWSPVALLCWTQSDMLTSSTKTKTIVGKASQSNILSCGLANAVWALRTIMLVAWAVSSKGVVHEQPPQVVFSIMLQPGSTNFVNLGISVLASSWLKLPLLMWSKETSRENGANGATYPSSSSSSSTIISTHNLLCWMS